MRAKVRLLVSLLPQLACYLTQNTLTQSDSNGSHGIHTLSGVLSAREGSQSANWTLVQSTDPPPPTVFQQRKLASGSLATLLAQT
ncbi:hypothetical protein IE53DRAFT_386477 [Violaceomyces palustris]|uniref:Uncharacterized protein n=1 Tax=Violaceomyces palustris TaxID=1673888 RepID=A0ACD0NZF3_9BASI|nr:hypothetical protein IE53DRAFT_386477 [Violaceomyces palustris]